MALDGLVGIQVWPPHSSSQGPAGGSNESNEAWVSQKEACLSPTLSAVAFTKGSVPMSKHKGSSHPGDMHSCSLLLQMTF